MMLNSVTEFATTIKVTKMSTKGECFNNFLMF